MAENHNQRRVLVADDDLMIRKMIIKVLEREGYAVEEAKDGADAIEHCQANSFDAILLDMMMPRIDGFHVLEWMRENRPDLIDRVLVMTAFTRTAAEQANTEIPIVFKPFDLHDLVEQVRERVEMARNGSAAPDGPESDASI
ncbi:MAG TPA: response regulator [Thermoanaerobaculia bacterium]|nr:response regulator [Thermoanaerobaculia bacterium]